MSQKKMGVILTYMSEAVKIVTALVYTPVMLRILGTTEYGLYQLVASTVSYLSLLNLGFTGAYTRFYTKAKNECDNSVSVINGMFLKIFMVMSLVCIICGIIIITNIELFFGDKLSADNFQEAKLLFLVLIISMAVSFPTSVFTCNIDANEKFIFGKSIILLQNILNPFLCLPLLILGYGNKGVVLVSFGLTVAKLVSCVWYAIKKLNMRFDLKGFNKSLFKEMRNFTFFIFLNQIIDQVNWNLDKYLIGRMVSLEAVAIYGIGNQLNSLYISCSNAISSVFAPQINRIVIEEKDDRKLTELFTKVGRIQFFVVSYILLLFLLYGKEFIFLWAGEEYSNAYYVAVALMVPMLTPLVQNIGIEIQRAKNKHQIRSIAYLIMAIINVAISIPLIYNFHEIGAALGTTVSLVIGNIIFMNIYYHTKLNINVMFFWKSIVLMCPATIVSCIAGIGVRFFLIEQDWVQLIFKCAIFSVIYMISFWTIGFNKDEKSMFINLISRIKR